MSQHSPAAAEPEALLWLVDACRVYTMGEVKVHALRDVDLEVRVGEVLMLVGPSGCGKSTLLNLIGGMDRPTRGDVFYRGESLKDRSDHQLTLYRRHHIGFVFQFYNLVPTLTALENVQAATELARDPVDARQALEDVGLAGRLDHFSSQLSGGEQQRVAIARALAPDPELILCDEPTGALDLETSRKVLEVLVRCSEEQGKTVVIVTHNTALSALGDRVAHLRDGAVREVEVNPARPPVSEIEW